MKGCKRSMNKHSDCENFCAIDAAKGICRLNGEFVLIDTAVCTEFEELPKCGNCQCFTQNDKDGMGSCSGFKKEYWSAAENKAVSCEGYVGRC